MYKACIEEQAAARSSVEKIDGGGCLERKAGPYWYYVSIPAGNDVRNPILAMLVHSVADLEAGTCRTSKYASRSEDSTVDIWLLVCVFRLRE